jgi:hypothetical protein
MIGVDASPFLSFSPYLIHSPSLQFCEIALHIHENITKMQEIVKKVHHDKALTRMQF